MRNSMRNIGSIFLRDLRKLSRSTAALVVLIGLLVTPAMYAWYNIGGSWDPYENTSRLRVAAASEDAGYQGELINAQINLGDEFLTALHENEDLDWVFTDGEDAREGVKSGAYYAAVIVPEDFSRDMMSLFSDEAEHPELLYYSNAKRNAIAPRITDTGAETVRRELGESFVETLSVTALDAVKTAAEAAEDIGGEELTETLAERLEAMASDLETAEGTLAAFENLAGASETMLASTAGFLEDTRSRADGDFDLLDGLDGSLRELGGAMDGTADSLSAALKTGGESCRQMARIVRDAADAAGSSESAAEIKETLAELGGQLQTVIDGYSGAAEQLEAAAGQLSAQGIDVGLESVVSDLNATVILMQTLQDALLQGEASLGQLTADAAEAQAKLDALLAQGEESMEAVQIEYEQQVKGRLEELAASVSEADAQADRLLQSMDAGVDGIRTLTDGTASDLTSLQNTLSVSRSLLSRASGTLSDLAGRLREEKESGRYAVLEALLEEDAGLTGAFLASPVRLSRESVYPVENYGSAMAPFYTTLSLWVGAVVLAAMLSVSVAERELEGLRDVTETQKYFGRYLLFLLLGLLQALFICLGDLYFLEIQCLHPALFVLAGCLSSVVYGSLVYTLSLSFGDIGKALSVILMVLQVAGAGGNFPIETAPEAFQSLYQALPFVHSMNAMRECVAGLYGDFYWTELGLLALYLLPSLALGVVLRRPVIRLNARFHERLESTHLM